MAPNLYLALEVKLHSTEKSRITLLLAQWQYWDFPWICLALWAARATAASCSTCHQPESADPFLWGCSSAPYPPAGVAPSQVQKPELALIKLAVVGECAALSFVKLSLQDLSTLEGVNSSSHLCVIYKLSMYLNPASI